MKKTTQFLLSGIGAIFTAVISAIVGYEIGQINRKQQYDLSNVGRCDRCILHLKHRTAVSWATHLIKQHGCTEDDAYTTIDRLYMRIHGNLKEEKNNGTE